MNRLTILCVAAACAGAAATATARQQPTFRSTTTHVVVDAIVTDKDGHPISDLTADDFEIVEHGATQRIADFEHVSVPMYHRNVDLTTPPAPPPPFYTNEKPSSDARAWVFMMFGVKPENTVLAKRMLTSFLQSLGPKDVAAVSYLNHNDKGQDFTTDVGSIARAFDRVGNLGSPTNWNEYDDWFSAVLSSLEAAPQRRKVIIFVSDIGFTPLDPARNPMGGLSLGDSRPTGYLVLQQLDRARRLNIPMYVIDPSGLQAPDLQLGGHMEDQRAGIIQAGMQADARAKAGLRVIAERTNARAFINGWNIQNDARSLVADNNDYYLLGFYPEPYRADGKFHEIDVRVKRPNLVVRRREGYQAADAAKPESGQSPAARLNAGLGAAVGGGDLPVQASLTGLTSDKKQLHATLTLHVDDVARGPDGLTRVAGGDHLDVKWIVINNDGKVRAAGTQAVDVPPAAARASNGRVTITADVVCSNDSQMLRAAVVSRSTGALGVVHVPIGARK